MQYQASLECSRLTCGRKKIGRLESEADRSIWWRFKRKAGHTKVCRQSHEAHSGLAVFFPLGEE
jgi:hypothetical protein